MKYLVLAYQGEEKQDGLSESERRIIAEACLENDLALRESGFMLLGVRLQSRTPTEMISIYDGKVVASGGGMSLAGVYIIHANDMNDAIRTASNMPQARLGTIEVRSVVSLDSV